MTELMSVMDAVSDIPVPNQYSVVGLTVWGAVMFAPPELTLRVRLLTVTTAARKLAVSVTALFIVTQLVHGLFDPV